VGGGEKGGQGRQRGGDTQKLEAQRQTGIEDQQNGKCHRLRQREPLDPHPVPSHPTASQPHVPPTNPTPSPNQGNVLESNLIDICIIVTSEDARL
jgi:hypothetical protein